MIKVACIGLGHRGFGYLEEMQKYPETFEITSICEINDVRLKTAKKKFNLKDEMCFSNEDLFFKNKIADLVIVSTQDQQHVDHCIKALKLGCDVLCEKPISNKECECRRLMKVQNETGGNVFVCHVMRYSPTFVKAKELIKNGEIGRLIMIDALEQVGFFHYAHSFIRGNWRNSVETSPMVIAKCCHDLDLLTWFADSPCDTISSIGDLAYFKKENKPKGASNRCLECNFKKTCAYSAYNIYIDQKRSFRYFITDELPVTDDACLRALEKGPYGRCVFECDNNVVDHEIAMMTFKNGVKGCLRFTGFTKNNARIYKFYGTNGEMIIDEETNQLKIKHFDNNSEEIISGDSLVARGYNHGGADAGLIKGIYDFYLGKGRSDMTTLATSVESHLMGFAAEKSRLANGKILKINH